MPKRKGNKSNKTREAHYFTKAEDDYIIELKEVHQLHWRAIADAFNQRFSNKREHGALQVRYSRKLQPSERNKKGAKAETSSPANTTSDTDSSTTIRKVKRITRSKQRASKSAKGDPKEDSGAVAKKTRSQNAKNKDASTSHTSKSQKNQNSEDTQADPTEDAPTEEFNPSNLLNLEQTAATTENANIKKAALNDKSQPTRSSARHHKDQEPQLEPSEIIKQAAKKFNNMDLLDPNLLTSEDNGSEANGSGGNGSEQSGSEESGSEENGSAENEPGEAVTENVSEENITENDTSGSSNAASGQEEGVAVANELDTAPRPGPPVTISGKDYWTYINLVTEEHGDPREKGWLAVNHYIGKWKYPQAVPRVFRELPDTRILQYNPRSGSFRTRIRRYGDPDVAYILPRRAASAVDLSQKLPEDVQTINDLPAEEAIKYYRGKYPNPLPSQATSFDSSRASDSHFSQDHSEGKLMDLPAETEDEGQISEHSTGERDENHPPEAPNDREPSKLAKRFLEKYDPGNLASRHLEPAATATREYAKNEISSVTTVYYRESAMRSTLRNANNPISTEIESIDNGFYRTNLYNQSHSCDLSGRLSDERSIIGSKKRKAEESETGAKNGSNKRQHMDIDEEASSQDGTVSEKEAESSRSKKRKRSEETSAIENHGSSLSPVNETLVENGTKASAEAGHDETSDGPLKRRKLILKMPQSSNVSLSPNSHQNAQANTTSISSAPTGNDTNSSSRANRYAPRADGLNPYALEMALRAIGAWHGD